MSYAVTHSLADLQAGPDGRGGPRTWADWSDERVELLKRLWAAGGSASQVAAELGGGISRNAVIGKVHRLGLAGRVKPASPAGPRRKRQLYPRAMAAALTGAQAQDMAPPRARAPSIVPAAAPVGGIPFLERRADQCAYPLWEDHTPVGERMYCGAPVLEADQPVSWCACHALIVWSPPSDRRRKMRLS